MQIEPKQALKDKNKGFPKIKNSKLAKQSFNWNNQGYQIKEHSNPKFKNFHLMNTPLIALSQGITQRIQA